MKTATTTSSAGYSLLELMVVLGILAMIAVVAVPTVSASVEHMTLAGDARALATQLRALREDALDQQTEIGLTLSGSEPNALVVSNGESIRLSTGTSIEIVEGGSTTKPPLRFVISPEGFAAQGLRLSRGRAAARVAVERMNGRVSIETER